MAEVPHGQWRATSTCHLSRISSTCQVGWPWASPTLILVLQPTQSHMSVASGLVSNNTQGRRETDDRVVEGGVSLVDELNAQALWSIGHTTTDTL